MDTGSGLMMMAAAFILGAALAGGAAWWWLGRKLRAALARNERVDQARQFAAQQASQARRQIESLQQEMAALRLASPHRPAQQRMSPLAPEPQAAPETPIVGFADTQVLVPGKR